MMGVSGTMIWASAQALNHNFFRKQLSPGNMIYSKETYCVTVPPVAGPIDLILMLKNRKTMSSDNILLTVCLAPYFYPLSQNFCRKNWCYLVTLLIANCECCYLKVKPT